MSYRAFKRLLGETSLERKCRFLFGGFSLLLITASFLLYARWMERLAYEQIQPASRLLMVQIVDQQLATGCREPVRGRPEDPAAKERAQAVEQFRRQWEERYSDALKHYDYLTFTTRPAGPSHRRPDHATAQRIKEFQNNPDKYEHNELLVAQGQNQYYGAVRATAACLHCHRQLAGGENLQEGDLMAVIRIQVPTTPIAHDFHRPRALLLSTALVTAVLIMAGSYLIVRYVIVKPVKHLKEVSDAISAGELNVRSEIQTGDEFEDLSHAFNRMLRNLVNMQDRLRKLNSDLDRKVDELAQANMALYESNRLKGDFLATMSHELRTPLNSILGFSDVLMSSEGLNERQGRWLKNIRSSGEQLLNLINDILDLAKIEAGKMEVRLARFSIYDVCEGMLTMFRPMAEKKSIDLKASLAPGIPVLRQDAVKLQQVLSNLLSNAVKFTPEGGRVLLKAEVEGQFLLLTVADTGVGIAREEQEMVFEKFRQAGKNLMTREHGGTGLGLSIVRELTKLLGGEVTLQSELGRGSTFAVRVPLQLSEEPRLELDLAHEGIDLSKAQRIDVRLYAGAAHMPAAPPTLGPAGASDAKPAEPTPGGVVGPA
jgi:signal transduction histidine kinase